jgi:integrase
VLSGVLTDAVADNLIARNPAAGVKLPRLTTRRKGYLTHQQVAALADAAGEHGALVLMLAYTGLRWGEAIGLKVEDLDMLRRRAMVVENAVQVGATIHVGTPKMHKLRTVPLPEFLLPIWRGSVRARVGQTCCSRDPRAAICGDRKPSPGGGIRRYVPRPYRGSHHTNCATPRQVWRCPPAPTSKQCSPCSDMPAPP